MFEVICTQDKIYYTTLIVTRAKNIQSSFTYLTGRLSTSVHFALLCTVAEEFIQSRRSPPPLTHGHIARSTGSNLRPQFAHRRLK